MAGRADRDQQSAGAHAGGGSREPGSRTSGYNGGGPGPNRSKVRPGLNVANSPTSMITNETTAWGAPVRQNLKLGIKTALPETAVPGKPAQSWASWKDQVDTYNKAARAWNAGAQKPSIANLINNLEPMGVSMQAPDLNKPKTYTDGTYHLGVNPLGAIGSLASLAIPGLGTPTSYALGEAYSAAGGVNAMLDGGPVPSGWDKNGAAPAQTAAAPSKQRSRRPGTMLGSTERRGNPGTLLGIAA